MATIKRTALLLEDEPLISMDLEATLADAGFAVVPVMTCADALAWLDGHTPDVVVVDIMLRDGPSDAVVEKLIGSEIPFIVHSGDHPNMHENTPFAHGAWVPKPAQGTELVRVARELVCGS
ncbi:response regulator [Devosia sp. LjRoot3]|uniref:response regulator n=1 Tax=Devosia sp. LjRoot3 TaxID=3342319 RepID=UPI003ECE38F0